jgi:hypothetical protein
MVRHQAALAAGQLTRGTSGVNLPPSEVLMSRLQMRPLGYMYKRIATRPEWLNAPHVQDVYSLSGCVSADFVDYINEWKHNGFWLFNSPSALRSLAAEKGISLSGMHLFYYEAYQMQYDEEARCWSPFEPEESFVTDVVPPAGKALEGFDIMSFYAGTSPECSPLSCNSCAETIPTNSHCLFATFEEAKHAIESNAFEGCEPGPYRIIAVYSVNEA